MPYTRRPVRWISSPRNSPIRAGRSTSKGVFRKPSHQTFFQCVPQHGYTTSTRYQSASRFWPFQWIEGAWLLALSVLLIAATV